MVFVRGFVARNEIEARIMIRKNTSFDNFFNIPHIIHILEKSAINNCETHLYSDRVNLIFSFLIKLFVYGFLRRKLIVK